MHNKKQLIFFVALLVTVQAIQAKQSWPLVDFDEIERFFDRQFEEFNQHIRSRKIQPSLTMVVPAVTSQATIPLTPLTASIQETDEQVVISIKEIDTQDIDARLNDDNTLLVLRTPQDKIEIGVEHNYVQIEIHQKQSNSQKQNGSTSQFMGTAISTIGESVSGNPELGNQTIDYDPVSGVLKITIPKQTQERKGKSVPIIIKQSDQESSENEK